MSKENSTIEENITEESGASTNGETTRSEEDITQEANAKVLMGINELIKHLEIGRERGAFSFEECRKIANALDIFKG